VLGEHTNVVHDIAWAPAMGRSYHLIATASRESTFKVASLLTAVLILLTIFIYITNK
jgi:hypothetical protein